jgi:hypothetical protein
MNKYSAAAALSIVFTILSGDLATAQMEFGIGPVAGWNVGTVSFSPAEQYPSGLTQLGRTGAVIGFQEELGITKMFYIVLQPTFVQNGYRVTGEGAYLNVSIDELEFPLLFKAKFTGGIIRPYAFAGTNFSFILSATANYNYPGLPPHPDQTLQTYPVDFAVEFGGGAEFNITPILSITGDVRYSLGLVNTLNWAANNTLSTATSQTTKASGVQVLMGVMFHVL